MSKVSNQEKPTREALAMTAKEILALELFEDFTAADWPMTEAAHSASQFSGIPSARIIMLAGQQS
jgi:hypothetical protein